MISYNIPALDLHGESKDIARILVRDFIWEHFQLQTKKIVVIHGIGEGILKKAVHEELKINKLVKNYKLNNFNIGETVIELNL
ncbi:MAG: Smr/MutS family protein [Bacilli bacterium]|nr:Smr/MutS family protein [Bacilli bacterium]